MGRYSSSRQAEFAGQPRAPYRLVALSGWATRMQERQVTREPAVRHGDRHARGAAAFRSGGAAEPGVRGHRRARARLRAALRRHHRYRPARRVRPLPAGGPGRATRPDQARAGKPRGALGSHRQGALPGAFRRRAVLVRRGRRALRRVRPDAAAARARPLRAGGPGLARPRSRRPGPGHAGAAVPALPGGRRPRLRGRPDRAARADGPSRRPGPVRRARPPRDRHAAGRADPADAAGGAGRGRLLPGGPGRRPGADGQPRHRVRGRRAGQRAGCQGAAVRPSPGGDIASFRAGSGPADRGVAWLWRARTGPVYRRAGVDRAARTLFVPSADRHLYALDAATGLARWRFAAGAPVLSEPLAVTDGPDGYVVFTAGDRLLAVEAATGRLAWSVPGRGFSAGRAACDGERVYTAAADGYARAHDLRTGREAWSYPMVSGDPHRITLYSGWDDVVMTGAGVVLVATVSGSQALEAATGAPRWTFPGSTMYPPAVLLGDGTALLATEQGVISRVNLDDGGAVWQASLGTRMQNAGLAVAGDSAWAVSAPGWLVRVRLADGDLAGSVRLTRAQCYSAPAVVGGTLITGDQDGLVHGIRLAS